MESVFIPIWSPLFLAYVIHQGILVQDRSNCFYSQGRQSVLGNRQESTQGHATFDYHERGGQIRCESCR